MESARKSFYIALLLWTVLLCWATTVWGRPVGRERAEKMAKNFLRQEGRPLGMALAGGISRTQTFCDSNGTELYHIVYLEGRGLLIVSADDILEPIVGFAATETFDPSEDNPLGALVSRDMAGRLRAARAIESGREQGKRDAVESAARGRAKWMRLEAEANVISLAGAASLSDVRTGPLVASQWGQSTVCNGTINVYNYYTPNHYVCGCVATAMAQIMRFYPYPTSGAYNWGQMPLVPGCGVTSAQQAAIGALCYDAGISVSTEYANGASSAFVSDAAAAFVNVFHFSNAIVGGNEINNIGAGLVTMINSNLDAGYPVLLGIAGSSGGHAVVADGYGYSGSTLYHHLNMGWKGLNDAWYNLPTIDAPPYSFSTVDTCVYNQYTSGSGEIVSGRVLSRGGTALAGVTVTARAGAASYSATTNSKGIYAIAKIPGNTTYTVTARLWGYTFSSQSATTGQSISWQFTAGNVCGVDLTGDAFTPQAGDFNGDGIVDASDLARLTCAWLSTTGSDRWDAVCNIAGNDGVINYKDFAVLSSHWRQ